MKIKVSETTTTQLDWLVLHSNGAFDLQLQSTYGSKTAWVFSERDDEDPERVNQHFLSDYSASTDWNIGGPIVEREICELVRCQSGGGPIYWEARAGLEFEPGHAICTGPTPLIAAMRCMVTSKLGEEVDVPEELK